MKTYYEVLGIERHATIEQIQRAYREYASKFHPDKYPENTKFAEDMMKSINIAFDTLSDSIKRKNYDDWLDSQEAPSTEEKNADTESENNKCRKKKSVRDIFNGIYNSNGIRRYFWLIGGAGLIIILIVFATTIAIGENNYEECLAELAKKTKISELNFIKGICRNKYPKLPNLSMRKNVTLYCVDEQGFRVKFHVIDARVAINEGNAIFDIISFSKNGLVIKYENGLDSAHGKIDPLTGYATLTTRIDRINDNFNFSFNCSEDGGK
jgi:hypothetical protein